MTKKWYQSRTLWLNLLGIVAVLLQNKYGYVLSQQSQMEILAVLNMMLRLDTSTSLTLR